MIGFCKEQWVKNEGTLRDVLSNYKFTYSLNYETLE